MSRRHSPTTGQRVIAGFLVLTQFFWIPTSRAASLYWNTDASAAENNIDGTGLGGTGDWDTTTANWWDQSGFVTWPNTNPLNIDNAVFSGPAGFPFTANTVTLSSGIFANKLSFARSGYTLTGGNLTLDGATPTLQANLGEFATINSLIQGTAGLTKTGGGTVKLGNAGNLYTGTTTISDGALVISNAGALGADTSQILLTGSATRGFGGGSLVLEGGYTSGVTLTRGISLQGLGPIPASGAALLSVRNNTITGAITNGTSLVNTAVNSASGRLTMSDVTVNGTAGTTFLTFGVGNSTGVGSYAITGVLAGSGTVGKTGSGTLLLTPSSASGYSGIFQISAGSMRVADSTLLGTSVATNQLDLNGGILEIRSDAPSFSTRRVNLNNAGTLDLLLDRAVGGSGLNQTVTFANLDYDSNETMVINSRNGYNVTFTAGSAVGNSGNPINFTYNGNGTATYGGTLWGQTSTTASSLTFAGTGTSVVTGNLTASGALHPLTKSGTGTVELRGTASTYTGATTTSGGALTITDFRTLNGHSTGTNTAAINIGSTTTAGILNIGTAAVASTAAGLTLLSGKVINLNGTTGAATINANQTFAAPVILGSFTATGAGTKVLTLGGTSTQDNIINGAIVDNSAANITQLVKADSGTWKLSGTNTYTGATLITGGTLKLGAAAGGSTVLANTSAVGFGQNATTFGAGGTLELVGASSVASNEVVGPLDIVSGANTIKVTPGSGGTASLTFATVGTSQATTAASSASTTVTVASTVGLVPGMIITGTGVSANAVIASISSGTTIVASASQTISSGVTLTFARPSGVVANGGGTVNFTPGTGSVIIGTVSAIGLLNGYSYFNGANFAYAPATSNATLRAPVYGTDAGFNTIAAAATLTAASNNQIISTSGASGVVTQAGTATIPTLKLSNGTTLTANALVTIQSAANNPGGVLLSGGSATINGTTGITSGGTGDIVIRTDLSGDVLTLAAPITSTTTGGLAKTGAGKLIISATNAQTGATNINEGTVQLSGTGRLSGANTTTNIRQGATLDLNGVSTGTAIAALNGAGTITNSNATPATLIMGNATTGAGTFSGIIQDGVGITHVSVTGTTGAPVLSGLNTYTGVTTIGTGLTTTAKLVSVSTLANYGTASSIGRGIQTSVSDANNAASLVFGGLATAGINYTGTTSVSIDRLFTLNGGFAGAGAQIANASGNNSTLIFNNTNPIVFGAGATFAQTLTLGGASTGDNQFNLLIPDNGSLLTGLSKIGAGLWTLGNASNSYTGNSTITAGALRAADGTTLPSNSPIIFGGGVLETSGNFIRPLVGTAPTGAANNVYWSAGGGFAGSDAKLVVAIGGLGSPTPLTWASGGFVTTGNLILNSTTALSEVEFRNAIDLNGSNRTIQVDDNANTFTDFATITGVISGTGGLIKTGSGTLQLFGANTYTGNTAVTSASTLVVTSLGNSATPGATSVGDSTAANTQGSAITLGNAGTTAGILQYVGPGETSDRMIRLNTTTGSTQIHADGSGPLILTNVLNDMAAGNKTLFLRGSNAAGNMITSVLADNTPGTNTLGITVDSGATWILTQANTYTGSTDLTAGALGAGDNAAFGTGSLRVRNGSLFAYGADRTLSNPLADTSTTTAIISTFIGDYSLNLTSPWTHTNTTAGQTITNGIVSGKTLTLGGDLQFNSITGNVTLTMNGSGQTILNGNITTSTAFNVGLTYSGTGSLTLGGTATDWNTGTLTVSSGTLKLGNSEVIPHGSATDSGNVVFSPAVGITATLDLNGNSETINGLTANSAGNVIFDNTSATPASLILGSNDQTVVFGGGLGNYTITDSGAGALSISKTGTGAMTIPTGATLTYQGSTNVTGGSMSIASPVSGTTGLSVTGSGSLLALTGGITSPAVITTVAVGGGSTLTLLDGAGSQIANLTALTLGSSGGTMSTLNLNVGDLTTVGDGLQTDTLTLLTGGTLSLFTGNQITFNLTDAGLNANQTYTLINIVDGGLTSGVLTGTDYILGGTPGGFTSVTINRSNTTISITTGDLITGASYWNALGTLDNWNDVANWGVTDKAGTTPAVSIPGQGTDVIFIADNITGGAPITTTLEQNFKINSLTFEASTTPANTPSAVTINPGTVTTNRLEIAPQAAQAATHGIIVSAGGPATVTIATPIKLGSNQTWSVADSTSTLTLGALQGAADVTKAGAGRVVLSTAADSTFNIAKIADVTVSGGTLEMLNVGSLGTTADDNLATVTVGSGGAFYYNNAVAGTVANPLTLNGGTLSAGGATQIYSSAALPITANSFINMRDSNSATLTTTQRNITLSGVLSGTGKLTVDSINTLTAGNQLTGTLTLSNANPTWSGGLDILRGNVTATNVTALGTGNITATAGKITFNTAGGTTFNLAQNITLDAPGAVLELNPDASGTPVSDMTVNLSGIITLGSTTNANAALRLFPATDNFSVLNLTNSVVLGNNASISVGGSTTRQVTISGVISETGGSRVLSINDDLGGWAQTNQTLRLNSANTYTGGTFLSGGTLVLGNVAALGSGSLTVNAASTIQAALDLSAGGSGPVTNNVFLSAVATISGTNGITFSTTTTNIGAGGITNNITGGGGVILNEVRLAEAAAAAARTLTIAGTGPTSITTVINNDQNNTLTNNNGTGNVLTVGNVYLSESTGTARTLTLSGTGATLVNGVIADAFGGAGLAGSLTKSGTGTVTLAGVNTFSGGITITAGVLAFSTVSDNGGGASNLGTGTNGLTLSGGTLSFVGSTSQSTNRIITSAVTASTLSANGTGGATITYTSPIDLTSMVASGSFNLTGTGAGVITGGINLSSGPGLATADIQPTSGNWTLSGTPSQLTDDWINTGSTVVINLNTTGILTWAAGQSTSPNFYLRGGATANLNANDAITFVATTGSLIMGDVSGTAAVNTLNMNGNTLTAPIVALGGIDNVYEGVINGPGTLTVTTTLTLNRGSISANLAGAGAVSKLGLGTFTLSGDNSGLTGATAVALSAGNLILDYTASNTDKLRSATAVTMTGGTLTINGSNTATTVQSVGGITFTSGANTITVNPGSSQSASLGLGAITRAANAGALRINLPASGAVTTTTVNGAQGLVGLSGFLTVKDATGTWFAKNDGANNIVPMASTINNAVTTWAVGGHITDDTTGFTGTLSSATLNSLRFNAAGGSQVNVAAGGLLSIGSGGILVTDQVTAGTPGIFGGTLGNGVAEIIITQDSTRVFELSSAIRVNSAITKTGNGTLKLSGANTFTGAVALMGGILQVTGGNAIGDTSVVTLSDDRVSTLQLLANETIGRLAGGSATAGLSTLATIDIGNKTLTINNNTGTAGVYAGIYTGTGGIIKTGSGQQQNTNASPGFTGTITVDQGLFYFTTAGTTNASAITVNKSGTLLMDKNGSTTPSTNQILDTTPITLNSADGSFSGETIVRGLMARNDQANTRTETVGIIGVNSGASYATVQGSATSAITAIIADNITRSNNATLDVRGVNMQNTTNQRGQLRIGTAGNETAFIAAMTGGASLTAGTTNISIVPWAIAENTTAVIADINMGNSLATYIAGQGFRALDLTTEYATYAAATAQANTRESLAADLTGLAGKTVNSLVLHNSSIVAATTYNVTGSGAGQTLAATSGALLFTLNPAAAAGAYGINLGGFDNGITVGGTEYVIHVVNPSSAATTPVLTATISSPLTSTADITKAGRGTLILSGTNTAGGGARKTTLNEGILEIADLDNIGGNTGGLVFAGGTLRLGSTLTDDISTRTISFLNAGGTIDTNGLSVTLAGSVGSGVGGLTKTGTGTLTLSGGTYTGTTSVLAGTLRLGVNQGIGGGDLVVNNSTFDLNGFNATVGKVTLADAAGSAIIGAGTLTSNGTVFDVLQGSISANLGGTSRLAKSGANTVILSGTNTYTGATELLAGVLEASSLGNLGAGTEIVFGGGTLRWATASTFDISARSVKLLAGTNSLDTNGNDVTLVNSIGGGGHGALTKLGLGILTLGGANNYAGATLISAGTLRATNSLSFGNSSLVSVDNTGTILELGDGVAIANPVTIAATGAEKYIMLQTGAASASLNGIVTIVETTAGAFRVDSNGGTITFNGAVAGTAAAGLRKQGLGTLILNGVNTYTAVTQVFGGTLQVNSGSNISVAATTVQEGVLDLHNATQSITTLTMGNGVLDSTSKVDLNGAVLSLGGNVTYTASTTSGTATVEDGTVNLLANRTFTVNDSTNTTTEMVVSAIIANGDATARTITKSGTGRLVLSGDNTYSGTTTVTATTGGILSIAHNNALGSVAAGTTVNSGTSLELQNNITVGAEALSIAGTGSATNGAMRNLSGSNTWGGLVTLTAAATIQSDAGTLTLDVASGNAVTGTFALTFAGAGNIAVADPINISTAALTKNNAGTLTLNAASVYSGTTTINGGTLLAMNATGSATGTGAVTVATGATLGGTGAVAGAVSLTGNIAPGAQSGITEAGQLTIGSLTVNAGASLLMQLGGATVLDPDNVLAFMNDPGSFVVPASWTDYQVGTTAHDQLLISSAGGPNLDGLTIQVSGTYLNSFTPTFGHVVQLLDWNTLGTNDATGTVSFDLPAVEGYTWETSLFASRGVVFMVPEPGRMLLLFLGLLGLAFRRRRRTA